MEYLTTKEAAIKWKISSSRVLKLATAGKIQGAEQIGSRWLIPVHAEKPIDGRTKEAKAAHSGTSYFRYPSFAYRNEASFNPPLSDEEKILKRASEAFYACEFKEADDILGNLPDRSRDKYIRISALYDGCMIDIYLGNIKRFFERFNRLISELEGDFPHRLEMAEYINEIEATLGSNDYFASGFSVKAGYNYHESYLSHLATISLVSLAFANQNLTAEAINSYELNCILLEETDDYANLESMHLYLGCAYAFLGRTKERDFHVRRALELAEKYNLYYSVAIQYFYMQNMFSSALSGFGSDLKKKLDRLSKDIHERYLNFMDATNANSIYKMLFNKDYALIYYAWHEYTNKEVAQILNISESSVSNRYSNIYASLGIKSKGELVKLYKDQIGGG